MNNFNMLKILNFIKLTFPDEWLSNLSNDFDEFDEAGVDIHHPLNNTFSLSIVILPERVGIALLKKDEANIFLDLGGFDYSFEIWEEEKLYNSLINFKETGTFKK
jgi:hypothetical protein